MPTYSLPCKANPIKIPGERIALNNVVLPGEFNPRNVRLWIVGNEYGALGAVWASCEQGALDELVDLDLGGGILIDEADADEDSPRLGNAGEPVCLDYVWLEPVEFSGPRDWQLLIALAQARGEGQDTL